MATRAMRGNSSNDCFEKVALIPSHIDRNSMSIIAARARQTSRPPPPARAASHSIKLGEWEVDCNGNIFHFARDGSAWRHSGFENVNE